MMGEPPAGPAGRPPGYRTPNSLQARPPVAPIYPQWFRLWVLWVVSRAVP